MIGIFSNRHSTYERLITEHVDTVISATDDEKLAEHLTECMTCTINLTEQLAVRKLLQVQPLVAVPRSFTLPYAPHPTQAGQSQGVTRLLRSMQVATAGAAVVVFALVGFSILGTLTGPVTQSPIQALDASIASVEPNIEGEETGAENRLKLAPLSDEPSRIMTEVVPNMDSVLTERVESAMPTQTTNIESTGTTPSRPESELMEETFPAMHSPPAETRSILQWAVLAASLVTALFALVATALMWRRP